MDINEAWEVLHNALDQGTMAAHGAGLINRRDVQRINEAEQAVAEHMNQLLKSNQGFVEHFNKQAAEEPVKEDDCGCPEEEGE
jgi:hypothetical protein